MKKAIVLLLCILMMAGCTSKPVEPAQEIVYDGAYYVKQLKNTEFREKNKDNIQDNPEFEELLDGYFEEKAVSDFLEFHYNIADYKALGLEKPEATFRDFNYGLDEETVAYYRELLDDLYAFDYKTLSYDQQYDYDTLEYECLTKLAALYFYRYKFLFKAGESVLDDVGSYFTDFIFYDEQSIIDYLHCLKDVERGCNDALVYTAKQAEDGLPMLDEWIDYTQGVCKTFIESKEKNDLIVSFNKRIDAFEGLDEKAKEEYKNQNLDIINNHLVPVYTKIMNEIEKYRGTADEEDYCLYKLDEDYAEFVFIDKGSNTFGPEEMLTIITDAQWVLEAEYASCVLDDDSWQKAEDAYDGKYEVFSMSMEDTLKYFEEHVTEYFPEIGKIDYTVEYLDPESAPSTVSAYYWQTPIDDNNRNIIRVNPNGRSKQVYKRYGTLAHEGIPGHMYQTVYYHMCQPSKFRMLLFYLAYVEGWAEYVSYYAYQMAGLEDRYAASVLYYDTNDYFFEYTIADLLTNYFGYSAEEIYDFFQENSLFAQDSLEYYESLRKMVIEFSGQYVPYGMGAAFLFELRDAVEKRLGDDFDLIAYNKAILETGVIPLHLLKEAVCERLNIER